MQQAAMAPTISPLALMLVSGFDETELNEIRFTKSERCRPEVEILHQCRKEFHSIARMKMAYVPPKEYELRLPEELAPHDIQDDRVAEHDKETPSSMIPSEEVFERRKLRGHELILFFAGKLGTNMAFTGCELLAESDPASIAGASPEGQSDGNKTIATSCRSSINSQGASKKRRNAARAMKHQGKNPETALSPRSKRFEEHKQVLAEAKDDLEEELSKAEAEGKPEEEFLRLKSAIATPFKSLYDLEDVPMEPDSEPEAEADGGHRRSQIEKLIERTKHFMVPPKLSGSLPRPPSTHMGKYQFWTKLGAFIFHFFIFSIS